MKKLSNFIDTINEAGRGRPRKNQLTDTEVKKIDGKDAEDNGTDGVWAVDEPTDDELLEDIDPAIISMNTKRLRRKFSVEEPFFIQGEAGWGKTSIIKRIAKEYGYKVETIYLDKLDVTDLGGMPSLIQGKNSDEPEMKHHMPDWAKKIYNDKKQKYLLFFDEMNQAAPDVLNALMPITLEREICKTKFKNFFVGAAGNYRSENDALSEIPTPLASRFKPIIIWETDERAWKEAFHYQHKKWDKYGFKKLINVLEDAHDMFLNPREVEQKIIQPTFRLKNPQTEQQKKHQKSLIDVDLFYDSLLGLIKEEAATRSDKEDTLQNIAQVMYDYCATEDENVGRSRSQKSKDVEMIDKQFLYVIKLAMTRGTFNDDDGETVGVSEENIRQLVNYEEEGINAEMFNRIIKKFKNDGIEFRFKTNADFEKEGYKNPVPSKN